MDFFSSYPVQRRILEQAVVVAHLLDAIPDAPPVRRVVPKTLMGHSSRVLYAECSGVSQICRNEVINTPRVLTADLEGALSKVSPCAGDFLSQIDTKSRVHILKELQEQLGRDDPTQHFVRSYSTRLEAFKPTMEKELYAELKFLQNLCYRYYGLFSHEILGAWLIGAIGAVNEKCLTPSHAEVAIRSEELDANTMEEISKLYFGKELTDCEQFTLYAKLVPEDIRKRALEYLDRTDQVGVEASPLLMEKVMTVLTAPAPQPITVQTRPITVHARPLAIEAHPLTLEVVEDEEQHLAPKKSERPARSAPVPINYVSPNYKGNNPRPTRLFVEQSSTRDTGRPTAQSGRLSDRTVSAVGDALFRVEMELSSTDLEGTHLLSEIKERFYRLTRTSR